MLSYQRRLGLRECLNNSVNPADDNLSRTQRGLWHASDSRSMPASIPMANARVLFRYFPTTNTSNWPDSAVDKKS